MTLASLRLEAQRLLAAQPVMTAFQRGWMEKALTVWVAFLRHENAGKLTRADRGMQRRLFDAWIGLHRARETEEGTGANSPGQRVKRTS